MVNTRRSYTKGGIHDVTLHRESRNDLHIRQCRDDGSWRLHLLRNVYDMFDLHLHLVIWKQPGP